MPEVSIVKRRHGEDKDVAEGDTLISSTSLSSSSTGTTSSKTTPSTTTSSSTTRALETYTLDHDQTMTLTPYSTLLTTKLPSSTTTSKGDSSSSEENALQLAFGKQTSSTSTDDSLVTVYTQLHATGSQVPSIEWIIPTITTNSLPSAYSGATTSNSPSYSSNYTSCHSSYTYSFRRPSSSASVSSYIDPVLPKSYTKLSSKTSFTVSKAPSKTSSSLWSHRFSSVPTTSPPSSSSSSSSSSSLSKGTITVTEYLEELTYTQVYIVTDSKLTLTTSLLATTSFYVDSRSSTVSLSPPAITTDITALKSRPDFDTIFKKKLSGGAIAGIAVGSILGFLLLLSFFLLYLRRKRKGGKSLVQHFIKDPEDIGNSHYDSTYVRDDSPDGGDDEDDEHSFDDIGNLGTSARSPPPPPPLLLPTSPSRGKAPAVPNRASKPNIQRPPALYVDTLPARSPIVDLPKTPMQTPEPIVSEMHSNIPKDDDLDMGLFDMKSTLSAINASSEVNHHLMPPVPPARKSLSSNRIDKMNYKVDQISPSPSSQLPIDRTMGVLYESPNEQCIWDEFEGAQTSGLMSRASHDSPIDSVFGPFESEKSNYDKKKSHYLEQLNINTDFDESPRSPILDSTRVRSGSGAKRYEYLANNVNIIKHELEKERLASPLSTNKPEMGSSGNSDGYFCGAVNLNNTSSIKRSSKIPPPIPKPRKNTISMK